MIKSEVSELLQSDIKTVIFEKKDGTIREMKCTLKWDLIPTTKQLKVEGPDIGRKENDNALAVWDIDKSSWRSFRIDSIKEIRE